MFLFRLRAYNDVLADLRGGNDFARALALAFIIYEGGGARVLHFGPRRRVHRSGGDLRSAPRDVSWS